MSSKYLVWAMLAVSLVAWGVTVWAQEPAAAPAAEPAAAPAGAGADNALALSEEAKAAEEAEANKLDTGFWAMIISSGGLGITLWLSLLATSIAAAGLTIDSFINIREKKIVPQALVTSVRESMEQGDVMKALKICEDAPGSLANILSAGFGNVKEGFDVIQDVVGVAADLEGEKLLQRVAYLNVCANLAPMLGLLGTVQGMIYAFASLATMTAGAAQQAALALNISQALWTTAAGLVIAIPAISFYTFFRNRATKIMLGMEGLTMDLIKSLRNVEVVEE
ncbi:MAG TPA: MotA/TolQ/ExbB proton channel family protein [Kiritimatiellia bacterium]|nr:MotA/TolQ/ExbB proton channel family protein [Kiritimatiellia bacterium]HRZ12182.1 MotA/TolQ/ExbB proton channel family protein [Kiritimatiellia bacterium]HSA18060.1 MotA/TolQ/ExbB proton channel family protein [Kiritimatiellia bacterium]